MNKQEDRQKTLNRLSDVCEQNFTSRCMTYISPLRIGLIDGLNLFSILRLVKRSSRIKQFLYKTIPFYIVFALVNYIYYGWYKVLLYKMWYTRFFIQMMWWIIWLIPAYIFSKVLYYKQVSALWETVYKKKKKKKENSNMKHQTDNWMSVAELAYGILLSIAYTAQITAVELLIPNHYKINTIFSIILFSWAISWSIFEYRMIYEGHNLPQRVRYFERRWLYFLGFGLPLSSIHYILYIDWITSISVLQFTITLLSIRAILSTPIKSPNYIYYTSSTPIIADSPQFDANKQTNGDGRRLRIFIVAEYFVTYVINWLINKQYLIT